MSRAPGKCPTCQVRWRQNSLETISRRNHFRCFDCKSVYTSEQLAAPDMRAELSKIQQQIDNWYKSDGDVLLSIGPNQAARIHAALDKAGGEK